MSINVNQDVSIMANRALVKEEIDIKEEICKDLTIDTTESNISDFSLSEVDPSSNNPLSNLITQEFPLKQEADIIQNSNHVSIGIDDSSKVKGIFSLETIGSKTLVVFRRLPEPDEQKVEEITECSKCGQNNSTQLKAHTCDCNSLQVHCRKCPFKTKNEYLLEKHDKQVHLKIKAPKPCACPNCKSVFMSQTDLNDHIYKIHVEKIYKGKYVRICLKCNISTESNSVANCPLCANEYVFSCKQCNGTFRNHKKLSHHLRMQCDPRGYYYCPQCDFRSRYFNCVRKHILKSHPHLGQNFDLGSITWKEVPRDANGVMVTPVHVYSNCDLEFEKSKCINAHVNICDKTRIVMKSGSKNDGSDLHVDRHPLLQMNRKKIVKHCIKCSKDIEFHHDFRRQHLCTDCKSRLLFKCTQCNQFMNKYTYAVMHLKLSCGLEDKLFSCKFCMNIFQYRESLLKHEEQHLKNLNQQVSIELPLEQKNLHQSDNFNRSNFLPSKSKNELDSRKNILSALTKGEKISKLFSCQKSDARFAKKSDLPRHLKYCDKKLQMQCKVLLTRLKIVES